MVRASGRMSKGYVGGEKSAHAACQAKFDCSVLLPSSFVVRAGVLTMAVQSRGSVTILQHVFLRGYHFSNSLDAVSSSPSPHRLCFKS